MAIVLPSGEKAVDQAVGVCPESVLASCRVCTFHNLIVFPLPDASVLPSGEKLMDSIAEVCLVRVANSCPDEISHSLILRPLSAEANILPSGEKEIEVT